MSHRDIRWKQRFQNFSRAFNLLNSELSSQSIENFSELEQAGLIQHFEITWDLTWKTIREYLESGGFVFKLPSPRNVVKEAASVFFESAGIEGSIFIEMLETRNELSHIYDYERFQAALAEIQSKYLPQLRKLHSFFESEGALS